MFLEKNQQDLKEEWKDIPGYEGLYKISSNGKIFSYKRSGEYMARWGIAKMNFPEKEMKISTTKSGYKYISLKKPNEKSIKFLLHRLVMLTFIGEPNGKQVNHIDGEKSNNNLNNLEYCTGAENLRHCIDVLGKKRGEGSCSKLTENQVIKIKQDQRILREIAKDYGVTLQAIWMIKKGKNWGHIKN